MARRHIDFLTLSFLISQMIVLSLNTVGADEISVFSQLKNFDATNTISAILSRNWTKNPECLIELTAIKNGIDKHEEWAIRGETISIHRCIELKTIKVFCIV